MANKKFTPDQQRMIRKAQKIIDEASVGYIEILKQHIQDLKISLESKNLVGAERICYRIQTQAATFGWPLATEISGWYKRILKIQKENEFNLTINRLFLDSFDLIVTQELKLESKAAINLLLHIETELKKTNFH